LAQIHSDVDQAASQSRKTENIASSYVAQVRDNWLSFHATTCLSLAASSRPASDGEH
jgi:hypothetical protein